jgi:hypothetical protein
MSLEENLKESIFETEKKLKEASINLERFDREYQTFLNDMGLTKEEIRNFTFDESNYPEKEREIILNEKKKIDARLDLESGSAFDRANVKKTLSEQAGIKPHWLFVR